MSKLLRVLAVSLIFMVLALPVVALASDISTANFYGTIRITNSSTANSSVSTVMTLSSADLISQSWVDSNFTRVAMRNQSGADVKFMPSINATVPWAIFVPSIGANAQLSDILYFGTGDMAATKYYFPDITGMAVTDHASLEPGANFTFELTDTYLTDGNILFKPVALLLAKYSTNVTFYNYGNATSNNQTAANTGESVNANQPRAGERINSFSGAIFEVHFWLTQVGAVTGTGSLTVRRVSDDTLLGTVGTINVATIAGVSTEYTFNTTPVAVGASAQDIRILFEFSGGDGGNYISVASQNTNPTAFGVVTRYATGAYTDVAANDIQYRIFYTTPTATVTGIADGEYDLTVRADSTNVWMTVGSSSSANTTVATVPNNANNWQWGGVGTPYIRTMKGTVGGVTKGQWDWDYATTFTDQSGNGNTGTPSFRTTSSDADVSATLVDFQPVTTAQAPPFSVTAAPNFITTNITVTSNYTTGNTTGGVFPGSALVDTSATNAGVPNYWLWGILAGFTMAMSGVGISWLERKFGLGEGALLFRIGVGVLIMGLLVTWGRFDFWMLVLYLMIVLAPAIASRSRENAASPAELNLIGMLVTTWLGLTVISRILQGHLTELVTTTEVTQLNSLMFTQDFKVYDLFTVPIVNANFFTEGLPALINWGSYDMIFSGNAQIIEYLLYAITAIAGMIVFLVSVGLMTSYVTRSR